MKIDQNLSFTINLDLGQLISVSGATTPEEAAFKEIFPMFEGGPKTDPDEHFYSSVIDVRMVPPEESEAVDLVAVAELFGNGRFYLYAENEEEQKMLDSVQLSVYAFIREALMEYEEKIDPFGYDFD